jgi:hypothetical protein
MKKAAIALVALMFLGSISFAQSTSKKVDMSKTKTEKKMDKKLQKAQKNKTNKKTEHETAAPSK